jgi:hypothetical protein
VSFAAITLFVASQLVFIVINIYLLSNQSGNVWIHPRMLNQYSLALCSQRYQAPNPALRDGGQDIQTDDAGTQRRGVVVGTADSYLADP